MRENKALLKKQKDILRGPEYGRVSVTCSGPAAQQKQPGYRGPRAATSTPEITRDPPGLHRRSIAGCQQAGPSAVSAGSQRLDASRGERVTWTSVIARDPGTTEPK
ncbi:unnamed protein product [Arctogadus glacialis]